MTQSYADTRIHSYRNLIQPTKKKKKRNCNQRIMQVEKGIFNPLVFSIYGGMGRECQAFYLRLSELLLLRLSKKFDICWDKKATFNRMMVFC